MHINDLKNALVQTIKENSGNPSVRGICKDVLVNVLDIEMQRKIENLKFRTENARFRIIEMIDDETHNVVSPGIAAPIYDDTFKKSAKTAY